MKWVIEYNIYMSTFCKNKWLQTADHVVDSPKSGGPVPTHTMSPVCAHNRVVVSIEALCSPVPSIPTIGQGIEALCWRDMPVSSIPTIVSLACTHNRPGYYSIVLGVPSIPTIGQGIEACIEAVCWPIPMVLQHCVSPIALYNRGVVSIVYLQGY